MAHAFDTGLGDTIRATVTSGVLGLLDRLKYRTVPTPSGYLRALVHIASEVRGHSDDVGIDMMWERLNGRAPGVLVATGNKVYLPAGTGGFQWAADLEVHLFILSKNMRSMEARELGGAERQDSDTIDPGVFVIMEHCEQLMIGQNLGRHIKDFRPVREEEIAVTNEMTLWKQSYQVRITRSINENRDLTTLLTSIATAHFARTGETSPFDENPTVETLTTGL